MKTSLHRLSQSGSLILRQDMPNHSDILRRKLGPTLAGRSEPLPNLTSGNMSPGLMKNSKEMKTSQSCISLNLESLLAADSSASDHDGSENLSDTEIAAQTRTQQPAYSKLRPGRIKTFHETRRKDTEAQAQSFTPDKLRWIESELPKTKLPNPHGAAIISKSFALSSPLGARSNSKILSLEVSP